MGWAKYSEDIIRIRDDNFYKRSKSSTIKLKSNKTINEVNSNLLSKENKLIDIKTRLIQIKTWRDFFIKLSEILHSNILKEYLNFRIEELKDIEERYYNEYYKSEYKSIRDKIKINSNRVSKEFLEILKIDFIYILYDLFLTLRNKSSDDSIELRDYCLDIKDYCKFIMDRNLDEPYIKTIFTLINFEYEEEVCPLCKKNTYKSANICVFCNFDRGE